MECGSIRQVGGVHQDIELAPLVNAVSSHPQLQALVNMCGGSMPVFIESVKATPHEFTTHLVPAVVTLARAVIHLNDASVPVPHEQPPDDALCNIDPHFIDLGPECYPEAPADHHFSHLRIDHTISRFEVGSQEEKAVQLLYRRIFYSPKPFPCQRIDDDRGPFYAAREFELQQPSDSESHRECLVYGPPQLSKTPEACATAWAATFIDGNQTVIGVRNKGGASTGSRDMANGIMNFNRVVKKEFEALVRGGQISLPRGDYKKFILTPRVASDKEQLKFDSEGLLKEPQVLIICMNAAQVRQLLPSSKLGALQSKNGARAPLQNIMLGRSTHPYPPKCHDPYISENDGDNRRTSRLFLIFDEDDLNRQPREGAVQRQLYNGTAVETAALRDSLTTPLKRRAPETESGSETDSEAEAPPMVVESEQVQFASEATGLRSAVRGVAALTATPAACGQDLPPAANAVVHQVVRMLAPANYVGLPFFSDEHCEFKAQVKIVEDRRDIKAITKSILYREKLMQADLWDGHGDVPEPFKMNQKGTISLRKRDYEDDAEVKEIWEVVDRAYKAKQTRSDKVVQHDGQGLSQMLKSMSECTAPERRGLVISNFTRTLQQKKLLASHLLTGELSEHTSGFFVIIYDHKGIELLWLGSPDSILEVYNAIDRASKELIPGLKTDQQEIGDMQYECSIRCPFANINHMYTALLEYAAQRITIDPDFRLRSVALTGDIGGRGLNYKPHGNKDEGGQVAAHQGYLTDMFFMFDATRTRQITTHGEYALQAIGRLCTLVDLQDVALRQQMTALPPHLWTSQTCWNLLETWGHLMSQWVDVLPSKKPGESMCDAAARAVEEHPQQYTDLHKVYVVATSIPSNKKQCFLRPDRMTKHHHIMQQGFMERGLDRPANDAQLQHHIRHNPEADQGAAAENALENAQLQMQEAAEISMTNLIALIEFMRQPSDQTLEDLKVEKKTMSNYARYLQEMKDNNILTRLEDLDAITTDRVRNELANGKLKASTEASDFVSAISKAKAVRDSQALILLP